MSKKAYKYAAWVPSVSGRLSFSMIGKSDHPRNCIVRQTPLSRNRRRFFVMQRRSSGDYLFVRRVGFPPNDTNYILIAETSPRRDSVDENITGIIVITKCRWWYQHGDFLRLFFENIGENGLNYQIGKNRDFRSTARRLFVQQNFGKREDRKKVQGKYIKLEEDIIAAIGFQLRRTGECIFELNSQNQQFLLPEDFQNKEEELHDVVSQAFFFLRDITHTHQHHDAYTDTLIDVYNLGSLPNRLDLSVRHIGHHRIHPFVSPSWRDQVYHGLFRQIIQYKKTKDERLGFASLGLLTYASSFAKISRHKFNWKTVVQNHKYIAASIKATQNETSNTIARKLRRIPMLTVLISFVSVSMSSLILTNARIDWKAAGKEIQQDASISHLIEFIGNNQFFILVSGIAYFIIRYNYSPSFSKSGGLFYMLSSDIKRLYIAAPRFTILIISFFVWVPLAFAFHYFFFSFGASAISSLLTKFTFSLLVAFSPFFDLFA